ncbi:MAG: phosphatidylglycerophosphatase A [Candidatus Eisenbacteria bacterium]|nr:phosphatidylglycerophosphatase A [Candidatus Eisenbacteria bacterium]
MKREVVKFLATGVYAGYFPVAPATFGSLICLILVWFLFPYLMDIYLPVMLAVCVIAIVFASLGERYFGEDGHKIVIDEFAGMMVSLYALPRSFPIYLLAFFLFRIFDIAKPFPARRSENLPSGLGVTADDLVSGLYANLVARAILLLR